MTLGQQEQRLQDVLAVLEAARVPPAQGREIAETLRALVERQAHLDLLFDEMCRDLAGVIGLLGTLEPAQEEQARAHARMLGHLCGDLEQVQATRQTVQAAADTMYLGFYALL